MGYRSGGFPELTDEFKKGTKRLVKPVKKVVKKTVKKVKNYSDKLRYESSELAYINRNVNQHGGVPIGTTSAKLSSDNTKDDFIKKAVNNDLLSKFNVSGGLINPNSDNPLINGTYDLKTQLETDMWQGMLVAHQSSYTINSNLNNKYSFRDYKKANVAYALAESINRGFATDSLKKFGPELVNYFNCTKKISDAFGILENGNNLSSEQSEEWEQWVKDSYYTIVIDGKQVEILKSNAPAPPMYDSKGNSVDISKEWRYFLSFQNAEERRKVVDNQLLQDELAMTAGTDPNATDSLFDVLRNYFAKDKSYSIDEMLQTEFQYSKELVRDLGNYYQNYLINPIKAGKWGRVFLNTLNNLAETMDILAIAPRAIMYGLLDDETGRRIFGEEFNEELTVSEAIKEAYTTKNNFLFELDENRKGHVLGELLLYLVTDPTLVVGGVAGSISRKLAKGFTQDALSKVLKDFNVVTDPAFIGPTLNNVSDISQKFINKMGREVYSYSDENLLREVKGFTHNVNNELGGYITDERAFANQLFKNINEKLATKQAKVVASVRGIYNASNFIDMNLLKASVAPAYLSYKVPYRAYKGFRNVGVIQEAVLARKIAQNSEVRTILGGMYDNIKVTDLDSCLKHIQESDVGEGTFSQVLGKVKTNLDKQLNDINNYINVFKNDKELMSNPESLGNAISGVVRELSGGKCHTVSQLKNYIEKSFVRNGKDFASLYEDVIGDIHFKLDGFDDLMRKARENNSEDVVLQFTKNTHQADSIKSKDYILPDDYVAGIQNRIPEEWFSESDPVGYLEFKSLFVATEDGVDTYFGSLGKDDVFSTVYQEELNIGTSEYVAIHRLYNYLNNTSDKDIVPRELYNLVSDVINEYMLNPSMLRQITGYAKGIDMAVFEKFIQMKNILNDVMQRSINDSTVLRQLTLDRLASFRLMLEDKDLLNFFNILRNPQEGTYLYRILREINLDSEMIAIKDIESVFSDLDNKHFLDGYRNVLYDEFRKNVADNEALFIENLKTDAEIESYIERGRIYVDEKLLEFKDELLSNVQNMHVKSAALRDDISTLQLFFDLIGNLKNTDLFSDTQIDIILDSLFGFSDSVNPGYLRLSNIDNMVRSVQTNLHSLLSTDRLSLDAFRDAVLNFDNSRLYGKYYKELLEKPILKERIKAIISNGHISPVNDVKVQILQGILRDNDFISRYNVLASERPVIFFDLETTGLNKYTDDIIGIGWYDYKGIDENASLEEILNMLEGEGFHESRARVSEETINNLEDSYFEVFSNALTNELRRDEFRKYYGKDVEGNMESKEMLEDFVHNTSYSEMPYLVSHNANDFDIDILEINLSRNYVHYPNYSIQSIRRESPNTFKELLNKTNDASLTKQQEDSLSSIFNHTLLAFQGRTNFRFLDLEVLNRDLNSLYNSCNRYDAMLKQLQESRDVKTSLPDLSSSNKKSKNSSLRRTFDKNTKSKSEADVSDEELQIFLRKYDPEFIGPRYVEVVEDAEYTKGVDFDAIKYESSIHPFYEPVSAYAHAKLSVMETLERAFIDLRGKFPYLEILDDSSEYRVALDIDDFKVAIEEFNNKLRHVVNNYSYIFNDNYFSPSFVYDAFSQGSETFKRVDESSSYQTILDSLHHLISVGDEFLESNVYDNYDVILNELRLSDVYNTFLHTYFNEGTYGYNDYSKLRSRQFNSPFLNPNVTVNDPLVKKSHAKGTTSRYFANNIEGFNIVDRVANFTYNLKSDVDEALKALAVSEAEELAYRYRVKYNALVSKYSFLDSYKEHGFKSGSTFNILRRYINPDFITSGSNLITYNEVDVLYRQLKIYLEHLGKDFEEYMFYSIKDNVPEDVFERYMHSYMSSNITYQIDDVSTRFAYDSVIMAYLWDFVKDYDDYNKLCNEIESNPVLKLDVERAGNISFDKDLLPEYAILSFDKEGFPIHVSEGFRSYGNLSDFFKEFSISIDDVETEYIKYMYECDRQSIEPKSFEDYCEIKYGSLNIIGNASVYSKDTDIIKDFTDINEGIDTFLKSDVDNVKGFPHTVSEFDEVSLEDIGAYEIYKDTFDIQEGIDTVSLDEIILKTGSFEDNLLNNISNPESQKMYSKKVYRKKLRNELSSELERADELSLELNEWLYAIDLDEENTGYNAIGRIFGVLKDFINTEDRIFSINHSLITCTSNRKGVRSVNESTIELFYKKKSQSKYILEVVDNLISNVEHIYIKNTFVYYEHHDSIDILDKFSNHLNELRRKYINIFNVSSNIIGILNNNPQFLSQNSNSAERIRTYLINLINNKSNLTKADYEFLLSNKSELEFKIDSSVVSEETTAFSNFSSMAPSQSLRVAYNSYKDSIASTIDWFEGKLRRLQDTICVEDKEGFYQRTVPYLTWSIQRAAKRYMEQYSRMLSDISRGKLSYKDALVKFEVLNKDYSTYQGVHMELKDVLEGYRNTIYAFVDTYEHPQLDALLDSDLENLLFYGPGSWRYSSISEELDKIAGDGFSQDFIKDFEESQYFKSFKMAFDKHLKYGWVTLDAGENLERSRKENLRDISVSEFVPRVIEGLSSSLNKSHGYYDMFRFPMLSSDVFRDFSDVAQHFESSYTGLTIPSKSVTELVDFTRVFSNTDLIVDTLSQFAKSGEFDDLRKSFNTGLNRCEGIKKAHTIYFQDGKDLVDRDFIKFTDMYRGTDGTMNSYVKESFSGHNPVFSDKYSFDANKSSKYFDIPSTASEVVMNQIGKFTRSVDDLTKYRIRHPELLKDFNDSWVKIIDMLKDYALPLSDMSDVFAYVKYIKVSDDVVVNYSIARKLYEDLIVPMSYVRNYSDYLNRQILSKSTMSNFVMKSIEDLSEFIGDDASKLIQGDYDKVLMDSTQAPKQTKINTEGYQYASDLEQLVRETVIHSDELNIITQELGELCNTPKHWRINNCVSTFVDIVKDMKTIYESDFSREHARQLCNLVMSKRREIFSNQIMDNISATHRNLVSHLVYNNGFLIIPEKGSDFHLACLNKIINNLEKDSTFLKDVVVHSVEEKNGIVYHHFGIARNAEVEITQKHGAKSKTKMYLRLNGQQYKFNRPKYGAVDFDESFIKEAVKDYKAMYELEDSFDIVSIESILQRMNSVYDDIYFLSEGTLVGSLGIIHDVSRQEYILNKLPDSYRALIRSDSQMCDSRLFNGSQFDRMLLGSSEYVYPHGYWNESDLFLNTTKLIQEIAGQAQAERSYIHSFIKGNSNIMFNKFFKDFNDYDIIDALSDNSDYVVVQFVKNKRTATGVAVKQLNVNDSLSLAIAKNTDSMVVPYEVYLDMYSQFNLNTLSNTFLKIWARAMVYMKVGHLSNPGTWIRNWIDATIKATGDTGNIGVTARNQLKAVKLLQEYKRIVKLAEERNELSYHSKTDILRNWDSYGTGYRDINITKDEFIFMEDWMRNGLSGGESARTKAFKKMLANRDTTAMGFKYGDTVTREGRFITRRQSNPIGENVEKFETLPESEVLKYTEQLSYKDWDMLGITKERFMDIYNGSKFINANERILYSKAVQSIIEVRASNLVTPHERFNSVVDNVFDKALSPMSMVEEVVRLGEYLALEELGYTRNQIFRKISDSQFNYDLKSGAAKRAELVFLYFTFDKCNLIYWCKQLENNPRMLHYIEQFWGKLSYDAAYDYTTEDNKAIEDNRSLEYMVLHGGIPVGNQGLYLKLNPSFLSAMQYFYSGPDFWISNMSAPIESFARFSLDKMGADYRSLFNDFDFEDDMTTWEKIFNSMPIVSTMYNRYVSPKFERKTWMRAFDLVSTSSVEYDDNYYLAMLKAMKADQKGKLSATLSYFFPTVFGEFTRYLEDENFEGMLAKQGKWYDNNTGKVVSIVYKNEEGLNKPIVRMSFAERNKLKLYLKNIVWDNNVLADDGSIGDWVDPMHFKFGGLNRVFDTTNPKDWIELKRLKKLYFGLEWDANQGKFVESDKVIQGDLNRTDLSFEERCALTYEYFGLFWDNNQEKFVDEKHYIPGGMNGNVAFGDINSKAELSWDQLVSYKYALHGEVWDNSIRKWVKVTEPAVTLDFATPIEGTLKIQKAKELSNKEEWMQLLGLNAYASDIIVDDTKLAKYSSSEYENVLTIFDLEHNQDVFDSIVHHTGSLRNYFDGFYDGAYASKCSYLPRNPRGVYKKTSYTPKNMGYTDKTYGANAPYIDYYKLDANDAKNQYIPDMYKNRDSGWLHYYSGKLYTDALNHFKYNWSIKVPISAVGEDSYLARIRMIYHRK